MKLYLLRHGEAEAYSLTDAGRELTERGKEHAQMAANWLAKVIDGPVSLWASPYLRTQQTAQPIADALSIEINDHQCLTPEMTPQKVVDELITEDKNIILVTHLPLVGRLASLLMEGNVFDQPWSATEVWELQGDVYAPGCLTNTDVWYPVLDEG